MKRCAFVVRGRVQGVGYRWFARRAAAAAGVAGWVRNDPDGTVRGEVQGRAADVRAFLEQLGAGPRAGRVDALEQREVPVQEAAAGFEIR